MENTCSQLLEHCLRGEEWSAELLDRAIAVDEGRALLSIVVERLGDLFEPKLGDVYARLFSDVIERAAPELRPRLRRKHYKHKPPTTTERVYVLSRVTLGADVAVTSVMLDAAKRRYPDAEIVFVGPQKSYEMFEADPRIRHLPAPYARAGSLADRLRATSSLWIEDGIVIDPDSRLTQLGLVSICEEPRYFFFDSRAYGRDGDERLPALASRWAHDIFGVAGASPYIAPASAEGDAADITVSLGVAENANKRLSDAFELELFRMLAGRSVLVDKGATAEEAGRVERALQPGMRTHEGAFAPFAAHIARSKLFIGYDSAAGHVAAACGVPMISVFAGAVSDRMFARWRATADALRGEDADILEQIKRRVDQFAR